MRLVPSIYIKYAEIEEKGLNNFGKELHFIESVTIHENASKV